VQHPHVGFVLCVKVRAFDPSLGVGWREILSWYPTKWAMEMVVDLGVDQQELPGTRDTSNADWYSVPSGTTYHFLGMSIDYNQDGAIDLAFECAHSLGESRLAPTTDQFMDRLFQFSWYGICTWDH